MNNPISIFIIDDHCLFSSAIGALLCSDENIVLVGALASPLEALEKVRSLPVDIVLIDAALETSHAIEVTREFKEQLPDMKVVLLGLEPEDQTILEFIEAGASGYVCRDQSFGQLIRTIEAVYHEETLCSPRIAFSVFSRINQLADEKGPPQVFQQESLTQRESEILRLVATGLTNKEIAQQLHLSLCTVKNHIHNVLHKLHVHYRRGAVRLAFKQGMLDEPRLACSRTGLSR